MLGDLGDVQQAIGTREELDKCAKLRQPNHLTQINLSNLWDSGDVADQFQRLLQAIEQPARVKRRLGVGASQELVENRVRYRRLFASGHGRSPSFPLCPARTRNS